MALTKFNLAPRGYGRSSFRFAESIQMGRVPIFLYDDIPWVPYQDPFGVNGGNLRCINHPRTERCCDN
eukprot:gene17912-23532_t